MKERERKAPRIKIIEEIKDLVTSQGFHPQITGGIYFLQGHLSRLVTSSLVYGLGRLILLFGIIAWIAARSLRVALSMILSVGVIPLCVIGWIGIMGIPLDVISVPASNVALAMGIDSMFHMVKALR